MFAWYALVWLFSLIFGDPYVSLDDMRQLSDNGFVAHIVGRILNTTQGLMVLAELLARRGALNSISWAVCRLVVATFALLAMLAPRFLEDVFRLCVTPFMLLLPALTTEVLALAYVAALCTSWLCWYIALIFIGILLPPLLGLVGLFELVYHGSTLSLLAAVWGTVYYEIGRAVYGGLNVQPRFRHRTAEFAGMIFKYILPFPAFKHLHRPFRFRALLPFLVTYPGLLCLPISVPSSYQPDELAEEGLSFSGDLYDFLLAYQTSQASLADEQLAKLLSIHLRTTSARYFAVKAEEKAHEAILDAVLDWRAMRNEVEEARDNRMEEQYEVYEMEDLGRE
ncbi:hypothetical protein JCM8097_005972 [Rhodosporidiobolus ruineniae]